MKKKRTLYLYIDESTFTYNQQEFHSVGMLVVEKEIGQEIIEEALKQLELDPDIYKDSTKELDMKTLHRRYFHATDDSMNAHSHLCNVIREHLNAIASYVILKPFSTGSLPVERKHRINTELVSLITTHFDGEIKIFIEQRGEFSQFTAEQFYENFYETIDRAAYSRPFLSAIYPKIEVKVVSKDNPGIQIVDFITWALNNQYSKNKKGKWAERLSLKFIMKYDQPDGDMAGEEYYLGTRINIEDISEFNPYPNEAFPIEDDFYDIISFDAVYPIAEQILNKIYRIGLPEQAIHFQTDLNNLISELQKNTTSLTTIKNVAQLFIRLFDTLPIYSGLKKDVDLKTYRLLLHVRRSMGLVIFGEIYGVPAVQVFKEIRENIIKEHRQILMEEPDFKQLTSLF